MEQQPRPKQRGPATAVSVAVFAVVVAATGAALWASRARQNPPPPESPPAESTATAQVEPEGATAARRATKSLRQSRPRWTPPPGAEPYRSPLPRSPDALDPKKIEDAFRSGAFNGQAAAILESQLDIMAQLDECAHGRVSSRGDFVLTTKWVVDPHEFTATAVELKNYEGDISAADEVVVKECLQTIIGGYIFAFQEDPGTRDITIHMNLRLPVSESSVYRSLGRDPR